VSGHGSATEDTRERPADPDARRGPLGPWTDSRTFRHGLVLARVDLTRTTRRLFDGWLRVLLLLVGLGPLVLGGGYAAYLLGDAGGLSTAAADLPAGLSVLSVARGGVAVGWVGVFVLVVVRVVGARGSIDNDAGILTTVPTREVALGRVLSEAGGALAWLFPVGVAVAVGYGVGGGGWTPLATLSLAALAVVLSAVSVAVAVGLGVRHLGTRVPVLARYRRVFAALAFLAYFGAVATGTLNTVVETLFETLQATPVAWPGDLLLLGTGVGADPLRVALVAPLVFVLAAAGVLGATVAGERHWFADPVLGGEGAADDDTTAATGTGGLLDRAEVGVSRAVGPGTAALVVLAWRRAMRAPLKLLYVAYPLLGGVGFVADVARTGEVPAVAPVVVLVFVAWAGSVAFTLNPLGDQGSALSTTLLSRVGGWRFAGAHVLAGTLLAAPLGTVAVAALAVAAGLSPRSVAGLAVGTPLVVVLVGLFAVGVGVALPRYDAVSVTRSTEAVVPSLFALVVHVAYLLVAVAAGAVLYRPALEPFVAAAVSFVLPFGLSVSADAVGTGALVVAVAAVVAPLASVTYAARRFRTVTVD